MVVLQTILGWIIGLLAKDVAVPVTEDVISGKVQPPPSTLVDAPAQPQISQELSDDLEAQIAAGTGVPPADAAD